MIARHSFVAASLSAWTSVLAMNMGHFSLCDRNDNGSTVAGSTPAWWTSCSQRPKSGRLPSTSVHVFDQDVEPAACFGFDLSAQHLNIGDNAEITLARHTTSTRSIDKFRSFLNGLTATHFRGRVARRSACDMDRRAGRPSSTAIARPHPRVPAATTAALSTREASGRGETEVGRCIDSAISGHPHDSRTHVESTSPRHRSGHPSSHGNGTIKEPYFCGNSLWTRAGSIKGVRGDI